jgi:hypothetical protein
MAQILLFDELYSRSHDGDVGDTALYAALERLPAVAPGGPWVAGGAIRRTVMGTALASDVDFFFANAEQYTQFCDAMKVRGAWKRSDTAHATTFVLPSTVPKSVGENEFTPAGPELIVQAVKLAWYASPEAVIDSFDFTICQFCFDGTHVICGEYALWDLGRNRLVPHRISFATATLRRLLKYTRQGFRICAGGLTKLLEDVVAAPEIIHADTQYID